MTTNVTARCSSIFVYLVNNRSNCQTATWFTDTQGIYMLWEKD